MRAEEAARLKVGERVYFQPDMLVPAPKSGIYTVLDITTAIEGGRQTVRVRISDDPPIYARPSNLGKVSRGQ